MVLSDKPLTSTAFRTPPTTRHVNSRSRSTRKRSRASGRRRGRPTPGRTIYSSSSATGRAVGTTTFELSARAVGYDVGDLTVRLASLDDIVASKECAARDKDRDALPELNELLRRQQPD
jgi:hypothetical protein